MQEYVSAAAGAQYLVTVDPLQLCYVPPCLTTAFGAMTSLTFSDGNASATLPAVSGSLQLSACVIVLTAWAASSPDVTCTQVYRTLENCLPAPSPPAVPGPLPGRASALAGLSAHGALAVYAIIAIVAAVVGVCALCGAVHHFYPSVLYGAPPAARPKKKRTPAAAAAAADPPQVQMVEVPGSRETAARLGQAADNAAAAAAASAGPRSVRPPLPPGSAAGSRGAMAPGALRQPQFASPPYSAASLPPVPSSQPSAVSRPGSLHGGAPSSPPFNAYARGVERKESLKAQGLYASPLRVEHLEAEATRRAGSRSFEQPPPFELPKWL